jgi:hypothetical protein
MLWSGAINSLPYGHRHAAREFSKVSYLMLVHRALLSRQKTAIELIDKFPEFRW